MNEAAFRIVREATRDRDEEELPAAAAAVAGEEREEDEEPPPKKNPAAVALGKLGGKKGGPARARALSPERRKEIARKAAEARWGKDETSD